jgi:hypothetical protein
MSIENVPIAQKQIIRKSICREAGDHGDADDGTMRENPCRPRAGYPTSPRCYDSTTRSCTRRDRDRKYPNQVVRMMRTVIETVERIRYIDFITMFRLKCRNGDIPP